MNKDKTIDYIELPGSDFDALQAFYSQVFGWTFVAYGDDYLAFNDGRIDGGFYRSDLSSRASGGSALVIFYVANLEACEQAVTEAGGQISTPIFPFPGGRRFHFDDPHGNELAVWTDQGL